MQAVRAHGLDVGPVIGENDDVQRGEPHTRTSEAFLSSP